MSNNTTISVLLLGLFLNVGGRFVAEPARSCTATNAIDELDVVEPMLGAAPVWLTARAREPWQMGPQKSLWVLSRKVVGTLSVTGKQVDGGGVVKFQRGIDGAIHDTLVISDIKSESVRPAGATLKLLRDYAFIPSFIYYPSRGCWELTARLGSEQRLIVRELQ